MQSQSPVLMVMAGPNGSGKSTITSRLQVFGDYVNADDIRQHLGCDDLTAAKIAESTREVFLNDGKDFTFETVLSTERNLNLMRRAKEKGYHIICVYVLTYDVKINIDRVHGRVLCGGHDVPEEKITARYKKAMALLPELFDVCDELYIYDNSADRTQGSAEPILRYRNGVTELLPNSVWSKQMLELLTQGKYGQNV